MTKTVVFNFVRVSKNICTICLEDFHTKYGTCVATVPLFAETFNKEVSNVLSEKPIILVELLFELRIVVIQDNQDGKRTACKKCARKIVNCYRKFAELRKALAGGRALDKGERLVASSAPCHKHLRRLVVQFLFEASDPATEVTPKASSTCENKAEGVQRRPSTKRALFPDQYSELEDENITSPIPRPIRQKPEEDVFSFDKQVICKQLALDKANDVLSEFMP